MKGWFSIISCFVMLIPNMLFCQQTDNALLKKYNYRVGNLGFASDSIELIIFDVPQGAITKFPLEVYNFGNTPISLSDGKSSKFVTSIPNPAVLMPHTSGMVNVEINIVKELPLGPFRAEVSLDTDDKLAKYKFLYLLTHIVPNTEKSGETVNLDTIPRLFFDKYNYDFGHMYRGVNFYHSFKYTNFGGLPVVISHIEVSPDCKLMIGPNQVIQPGESGIIRLKVRMRGRVGVQHRSVVLSTNDPVTPEITLGIHGSVRKDAPQQKNPNFCNESPGHF